MSVLSLPSAWNRSLNFQTPSFSVHEIDIQDASSLARFIARNQDRIAKASPTYACSDGDLTEQRMREHILDWRRERRSEEGGVTMVCYAPGDPEIKATLDLKKEESGLFEVGMMGDLSLSEDLCVEAMQGLTLQVVFNRLKAGSVRMYPLPDDLESRRQAEKAGFSFLREEQRAIPFFNIEFMRLHAVYERTPS